MIQKAFLQTFTSYD